MRREVHSDHSVQLPATTATPSVQSDPSLEDLDSFDLDSVSFEELLNDANNISNDQQETPTDNIDPIPLQFNPDDMIDFNADDLDCLFD